MTIGYWAIRNPWQTCLALDEFGAGTLDGVAAHGGARDACGPAALENIHAAYDMRSPMYTNIGLSRAAMITNGQWSQGATVANPVSNGCFIENVAWEATRLGLDVRRLMIYQDAILSESLIRYALAYQTGSIFIVTNAAALAGNESGIHNHFVAVAGYGGDLANDVTGKLYILNSDIAGQHGLASGQWTPIAQFLAAQPHGYAVISPYVVTPPVNPNQGAIDDITKAQALLADALKKLGV